ncbi:MAG: hypothetical protein HY897_20260 [Deltaproteobacteria bacterium]|nr:hypothetical protein [Deltaproteobacteria bacterium]
MLGAVERFFQHAEVKFVLAVLIVTSVLPFDAIHNFDLAFFAVFGLEFVVRTAMLRHVRGWRLAGEMLLLAIDAVAVLSFLPLHRMFPDAHWILDSRYLRLLRLVRLSLLIRYLMALTADLWAIVRRHEIKYQLGFLLGAVAMLTLVSGIVLHVLEVPVDLNNDGEIEKGSLKDLLWWSFRAIESADNLVQSLKGPVVHLIFSVFLTIAGVFIMSLIIGLGASVVQMMLASNREKPVKVMDHLVVIGRGPNLPYLLRELVQIIRKRRRRMPIVLLSDSPVTPPYLYESDLSGVEYRAGDLSDLRALELVNPAEAARILVLYDQDKREHADATTLSTVLALRERTEAAILLELRHRRNTAAALAAGGGSITPVPLAKILGNILCQNLVFPGIDRVYEELLTAAGNDINVREFSPRDRARLVARGGTIPFGALLAGMYRKFGVVLIGVLVEKDGKTIPCLDPIHASDPAWAPAPGAVRPAGLSGLIGICRRERDLARAATWMTKGCPGAGASEDGPAPEVSLSLDETFTKLKRVLVVGENEMLPTLVEETGRFVPGVAFDVLVQGCERGRRLARVLQERWRCALHESPEGSGVERCLERLTGGRDVSIHGAEGDLMHMLSRDNTLGEARYDAAVFLADNEAPDPDAQNLLWLFSLLDAVREGRVASGERFHVLAEILSSAKGEIMERRAATSRGRRVRALSTQKLRTYFMAHCLFVPHLHRIYDELVSSEGLEFCHVVPSGVSGKAGFCDLLGALAARGMILFGVEYGDAGGRTDATFVVNPAPRSPDALIDMDRVKRLFVTADTDTIGKKET